MIPGANARRKYEREQKSLECNNLEYLPQHNVPKFASYNKTLLQTHSTPLMEASRIGNVEIAQLLLNKGKAQPDLPNEVL